MATFGFRAKRWQARVRRKGNPELTNFLLPGNMQNAGQEPRRQICIGFATSSPPKRKGRPHSTSGHKGISLVKRSFRKLRPQAVVKYRDERLQTLALEQFVGQTSNVDGLSTYVSC